MCTCKGTMQAMCNGNTRTARGQMIAHFTFLWRVSTGKEQKPCFGRFALYPSSRESYSRQHTGHIIDCQLMPETSESPAVMAPKR